MALELLDPGVIGDPSELRPYLAAALLGFLLPPVWLTFGALTITGLLAHALLVRLRRGGPFAYAVAGALVGIGSGSLIVGQYFQQAIPAAILGVPIGAFAGSVFWRLRRPDHDLARSTG